MDSCQKSTFDEKHKKNIHCACSSVEVLIKWYNHLFFNVFNLYLFVLCEATWNVSAKRTKNT